MSGELYVVTTIKVDGQVVKEVDGRMPLKTRTDPDLKLLLGAEDAKIHMGVSDKIGMPNFSSITITAGVTLTCDQTSEGIRKAQDAAIKLALDAVDTHIDKAHEMMRQYIEGVAEENEDG